MESIMAGIFAISGLVVVAITLSRSIAKTKSATQWVKGYNLKCNMSKEKVLELLKNVKYPQKEKVSVNAEGVVLFKTKCYEYPVELSLDESGNAVISLNVNWIKLPKHKSKKLAIDVDYVYQFIKQEIEGVEVVQAMEKYEKGMKMQKILNIASVICLISALSFMFLG